MLWCQTVIIMIKIQIINKIQIVNITVNNKTVLILRRRTVKIKVKYRLRSPVNLRYYRTKSTVKFTFLTVLTTPEIIILTKTPWEVKAEKMPRLRASGSGGVCVCNYSSSSRERDGLS